MSGSFKGKNEFKTVGKRRPFKSSGDEKTKPKFVKSQAGQDGAIKQKKEFDPSKPFCKVCRDAGKTEEEYTSHFVRESTAPDAAVVCPTLLAQSCRYCRKQGHTVRYCSLLAGRVSGDKKFKPKKPSQSDQDTKSKSNTRTDENEELTTKQIMSNNPFGALHDEDDDEDENDEPISDAKNDWDALHQGKTLNYGDLKVKCVDGKLVFEVLKSEQNKSSPTQVQSQTTSKPNERKTWADVASSSKQ